MTIVTRSLPLAFRTTGGVLALVGALLCGTLPAHAVYTFTKIADNTTAVPGGGTFGGLGIPVISGNSFAFEGIYTGGTGTRGIFTYTGGVITPVVRAGAGAPATVPGGGTFSSLGNPGFSGNRISFTSDYSGGTGTTGVFTTSGGTISTVVHDGIGNAPGGGNFLFFNDPQVSGDTTALIGYSNGVGGSRGIYTSTGGTLTTVTRAGDGVPGGGGFTDYSNPTISGGTVAFRGDYSGGGSTSSAIFTASGGTITSIVRNSANSVPGGGSFTSFGAPSISGSTLSFLGSYTGGTGTQGVFTSSGGMLSLVANDAPNSVLGGAHFTFLATPSVMNNTAVFYGEYSNGGSLNGTGIFTSISGVLVPIIRTGDPLFGSTCTRLTTILPNSAEGNTVGFTYSLANGTSGIAFTSIPVAVPESDTALLVAFALPVIGGLVIRRKKSV